MALSTGNIIYETHRKDQVIGKLKYSLQSGEGNRETDRELYKLRLKKMAEQRELIIAEIRVFSDLQ